MENRLEKFNDNFDRTSKNEITLGPSWKDTYYASFRELDDVGLEEYMDLAEHYANVVLGKRKEKSKSVYSKKLRKNNNEQG